MATKANAYSDNGDIRLWVADSRARRVPLFVIEHTGLETKRDIVAKYGEGSTFRLLTEVKVEKGKTNGKSNGKAGKSNGKTESKVTRRA